MTAGVPLPSRAAGDDGESLIEVLLSIAIMGLAFVAALGGMRLGLMGSQAHRSQATAETVMLNAVEKVKAQSAYQLCAAPSTYLTDAQSVAADAGWATSTVSISSIQYWNGSAFGATCVEGATGSAALLRIQLVTLQVTSPEGDATETMAFVKRS